MATRKTTTASKRAPRKAATPRKAVAKVTTSDVAELRTQIKKVRDYRWVVAKRNDEAKLAELDAKLAELRTALDAASGKATGPMWIVSLNVKTGKATVASVAEAHDAKAKVADLRAAGMFVTVVAKEMAS
jgi:hypothetical protein